MTPPHVITLESIKRIVSQVDVVEPIKKAFVTYSNGGAVVPPVGELIFEDPPGDVHIKYGHVHGDDVFVIKVASGFPGNSALGLPAGNGLMLVFDRITGAPRAILLDQGYLTDLRTAAAGAAVADALAPSLVQRIGILGAGVQGKMQVQILRDRIACRDVTVWSRTHERALQLQRELIEEGYSVQTVTDPRKVAATCNLIITATPSTVPLLSAPDIQPGTHITAIGSDNPDKRELDTDILRQADIVAVDSLSQSEVRGEVSHALREGNFDRNGVRELGHIFQNRDLQRRSDEQITVADLTGVAVQDIVIARIVFDAISSQSENDQTQREPS